MFVHVVWPPQLTLRSVWPPANPKACVAAAAKPKVCVGVAEWRRQRGGGAAAHPFDSVHVGAAGEELLGP